MVLVPTLYQRSTEPSTIDFGNSAEKIDSNRLLHNFQGAHSARDLWGSIRDPKFYPKRTHQISAGGPKNIRKFYNFPTEWHQIPQEFLKIVLTDDFLSVLSEFSDFENNFSSPKSIKLSKNILTQKYRTDAPVGIITLLRLNLIVKFKLYVEMV